jgi:ectoine hydroxylase-related dioxygenase (phytanoyl-CoA dioxygenase family)
MWILARRKLKKEFWKNGYVVIRNVFQKSEMDHLRDACHRYDQFNAKIDELTEAISKGQRPSFSTIINHNSTDTRDILSKVARKKLIMDSLDFIFDDTSYAFHNKIIAKPAGMVGFSYHQDYAYWYHTGCLYPMTASTFCAIDKSTTENGCLKFIPESHKLGRQDHINFGTHPGDRGMERARLEIVIQRLGEKYIELDSGDVCIFHGNLIHGSDDNTSERDRLALVATYNFKTNNLYQKLDQFESGHPKYSIQERLDEEITEDDLNNFPLY